MEKQKEYIDSLVRIINNELPIIFKYNKHLYQIFISAIELVLDQSQQYINNQHIGVIDDSIKQEVDEIVANIEEEFNKCGEK